MFCNHQNSIKTGDCNLGPTQRAVALWFWERSTGRSTDRLNGRFFDRQPVDRKVIFDLSACQRADSKWGINIPPFELFLNKFLKSKNFIFSSVLYKFFKRVFRAKRSIFICFKRVEKFKEKESLWDCFLYINSRSFSKSFSL